MATLFSSDFSDLGSASLTGKACNNALGGTDTPVFGIFTGGVGNTGDGAGMVNYGPTSMSLITDSRIRKMRVYFDPLAGTSGPMLTAFGRNDPSNLNARRIALLWASGQTSLRLAEAAVSGGSLTNKATKTTVAPGAPVWLEVDATTGTTVFGRVFAEDGTTLLHEISFTFPSLPPGDKWGFGGYQNGNTGKFDNITFSDGPTLPAPVLSVPVATPTLSTAVSTTVTTDVGNGALYAIFTSGTPTDTTIIQTGTVFPVTTTGTQAITLSGLPSSSTGQVHIVHVLPTLERSLVARSNVVTLNDPTPPPDGASSIVIAGNSVTVVYTPVTSQVDSATASIPVAGTPNGAVAEPAREMTLSGGAWRVTFEPVEGDYGAPVVLATNHDSTNVPITGAPAFDLISIRGSDQVA